MRIAALIIGIIGSLAGIGGALFALLVGGISSAFGTDGAGMVVGLGWAAIVISLVALVAAALAMVKPMEAGITMIIAGIAGVIAISAAYVVGGPLLIIAGTLAIIGKREVEEFTDTFYDTAPSADYRDCPFCGEEVKKMAIKCRHCKSSLVPQENEQEESMLTFPWIFGTLLLPLIGLVGGIYGLIKRRRGAGWLLGITIISWTLALIIFGPFITSSIDESFYAAESVTSSETDSQLAEWKVPNPVETTQGGSDSTTLGEKNALKSAQNYLSFMPFSYSGLINQLEYEGYTHEEAVFAADNCDADWNKQAALKAESYLDIMSFSREGLIAQLEFEGFTRQQAEYGVQAVGY